MSIPRAPLRSALLFSVALLWSCGGDVRPKGAVAADDSSEPGADGGPSDGAGDGAGDGGAAGGGSGGGGEGADGGAPRDIGCADIDLGSELGEVARGRIDEAGDQHGFCAEPIGADGEDLLFYWVAPAAGPYIFSSAGSDFDTMLTLYRGACASLEACNDDYDGVVSAVDGVLEADEVVVLALDAYSFGDGGNYVILIESGALPEEHWGDTGDTGDTGGADTSRPGDSGGPSTAGLWAGETSGVRAWMSRVIHWIERGVDRLFA